MIPGTIAPGTVLYHGRADGNIPQTPEWLATEPDFSYLICYTGTCQMLSFATTRELRILFFDGSGAAKLPTGSLDTQDILFWGAVREDLVFEEVKRIEDACKWGKPLGVDGFVRCVPDAYHTSALTTSWPTRMQLNLRVHRLSS
jgi:hypothetical protein